MAYFKELSLNLLGRTEENYKRFGQDSHFPGQGCKDTLLKYKSAML